MAKIRICDACGEPIKDYNDLTTIEATEYRNDGFREQAKYYDLCKKCSKKIYDLLESDREIHLGSITGLGW